MSQADASSAAAAAKEKQSSKSPAANGSVIDPERLYGMEFVRATECAALSAYKWMGKGDKESADFAACDAIRGLFDSVNISGLVTVGGANRDDAPGFLRGRSLGLWGTGWGRRAFGGDPTG